MQPARLYVAPHPILNSLWTSIINSPSPSRAPSPYHIRAILRLPGELRPHALRTFTSLAYHQEQQHQQLGPDQVPSPNIQSLVDETFRFGGLLDASEQQKGDEVNDKSRSREQQRANGSEASLAVDSTSAHDQHGGEEGRSAAGTDAQPRSVSTSSSEINSADMSRKKFQILRFRGVASRASLFQTSSGAVLESDEHSQRSEPAQPDVAQCATDGETTKQFERLTKDEHLEAVKQVGRFIGKFLENSKSLVPRNISKDVDQAEETMVERVNQNRRADATVQGVRDELSMHTLQEDLARRFPKFDSNQLIVSMLSRHITSRRHVIRRLKLAALQDTRSSTPIQRAQRKNALEGANFDLRILISEIQPFRSAHLSSMDKSVSEFLNQQMEQVVPAHDGLTAAAIPVIKQKAASPKLSPKRIDEVSSKKQISAAAATSESQQTDSLTAQDLEPYKALLSFLDARSQAPMMPDSDLEFTKGLKQELLDTIRADVKNRNLIPSPDAVTLSMNVERAARFYGFAKSRVLKTMQYFRTKLRKAEAAGNEVLVAASHKIWEERYKRYEELKSEFIHLKKREAEKMSPENDTKIADPVHLEKDVTPSFEQRKSLNVERPGSDMQRSALNGRSRRDTWIKGGAHDGAKLPEAMQGHEVPIAKRNGQLASPAQVQASPSRNMPWRPSFINNLLAEKLRARALGAGASRTESRNLDDAEAPSSQTFPKPVARYVLANSKALPDLVGNVQAVDSPLDLARQKDASLFATVHELKSQIADLKALVLAQNRSPPEQRSFEQEDAKPSEKSTTEDQGGMDRQQRAEVEAIQEEDGSMALPSFAKQTSASALRRLRQDSVTPSFEFKSDTPGSVASSSQSSPPALETYVPPVHEQFRSSLPPLTNQYDNRRASNADKPPIARTRLSPVRLNESSPVRNYVKNRHLQPAAPQMDQFPYEVDSRLQETETLKDLQHQLPEFLATSLLVELFPEEGAEGRTEPPAKMEHGVPRLSLPSRELIQPLIREFPSNTTEEKQDRGLVVEERGSCMTVLELQSGNASLTASDFHRLIPKGKYIKEWKVKGDFKTVFPRRDPWTLERNPAGHYYIVFENGSSAQAYQDHCHHVHRLARQYTPSSLSSPIPPPPGYFIDGEEVHSLIQNFTLVAPTQPLILSMYTIGPGFYKRKAELFGRGGYPEIVGPDGQSKLPQVLLRVLHGPQPTYFEIQDAISRSNEERNLAWDLIEGPDRVRMLEMDRYSRTHEDELDADYQDQTGKAKTPKYGQTWILAFTEWDEAKSFVREWHRRPFPWGKKKTSTVKMKTDTSIGMVEAELLW